MFKIKNPFKTREEKNRVEKIKGIGKLAWKSINSENEKPLSKVESL